METIDLSQVFMRMEKSGCNGIRRKKRHYTEISDFWDYLSEKLENIARLGVALDEGMNAYDLDGVALRCWDRIEKNTELYHA